MSPRVVLASETIRTLGGLNLPGELAVKRILKPVTYVLAALYFLVDAAFMAIAKPISDWLARHVVLRRLRAWIRSSALPVAGAVFGAGDHAGTGQTGGGLSGRYRSDGEQPCDIDRRRASKARAGRAPVQPYPGQADENSSLCLGVHKIPRSQGMAGSHRGLASHSRDKQGCQPVCNRDEKIRCLHKDVAGRARYEVYRIVGAGAGFDVIDRMQTTDVALPRHLLLFHSFDIPGNRKPHSGC